MYVKYVTGLQNMLQRYYNVLTSLNPAEVSTCPVKMPDPIHIRSGSTEKHWPEASPIILAHRLASGPDPFGQNLTQSARTKSDPGWFFTILSGTSAEEQNRVSKWQTGSRWVASCQTPSQMIPTHHLASRPDVFGQTLTRRSISGPCRFCTI